MVERRVRWNVESDPKEEPTPHRWWFLIVNKPREIKRIRQRIFERAKPIDDYFDVLEGEITKSEGLHYLLMNFRSSRGPHSLTAPFETSVYKGNIKRDRELYTKKISYVPYVSGNIN